MPSPFSWISALPGKLPYETYWALSEGMWSGYLLCKEGIGVYARNPANFSDRLLLKVAIAAHGTAAVAIYSAVKERFCWPAIAKHPRWINCLNTVAGVGAGLAGICIGSAVSPTFPNKSPQSVYLQRAATLTAVAIAVLANGYLGYRGQRKLLFTFALFSAIHSLSAWSGKRTLRRYIAVAQNITSLCLSVWTRDKLVIIHDLACLACLHELNRDAFPDG